jgi:hypothetical protein
MMPKLTLSADRKVIEKAKRIAVERGTSVSAMFSQMVDAIGSQRPERRRPAPITRRLRGLAKVSPDKSDRELFEAAILRKNHR